MQIFASICAGVVAGYLAFAAFAKLFSWKATLNGFAENKWKPAWLFFIVFVITELGAAFDLFVSPRLGGYVAATLLFVYFVGELVISIKKPSMNCWCYGSSESLNAGNNLFLLGPMLAGAIIVTGLKHEDVAVALVGAVWVFFAALFLTFKQRPN